MFDILIYLKMRFQIKYLTFENTPRVLKLLISQNKGDAGGDGGRVAAYFIVLYFKYF